MGINTIVLLSGTDKEMPFRDIPIVPPNNFEGFLEKCRLSDQNTEYQEEPL